jgi:GH15 family glucan-1,4-alpha-glucosidase
MAWIALDRAVKAVERFALEGLERWRWLGGEIHAELRQESRRGQGHVQAVLERRELDASVFVVPLVGFLPASDERVAGTIEAIERDPCAMVHDALFV